MCHCALAQHNPVQYDFTGFSHKLRIHFTVKHCPINQRYWSTNHCAKLSTKSHYFLKAISKNFYKKTKSSAPPCNYPVQVDHSKYSTKVIKKNGAVYHFSNIWLKLLMTSISKQITQKGHCTTTQPPSTNGSHQALPKRLLKMELCHHPMAQVKFTSQIFRNNGSGGFLAQIV